MDVARRPDGGSEDMPRWDGVVFVVPPVWCDVREERIGCSLDLRGQLREPGCGELELLPRVVQAME